jgi:hypothetical protein
VEPKVLALVWARFLWRFAYSCIWRGSKGSSTGCEVVLWDPREPLSWQPWLAPHGVSSQLLGGDANLAAAQPALCPSSPPLFRRLRVRWRPRPRRWPRDTCRSDVLIF